LPLLINCRHCRHYYLTWEARNPYGCRAMGFKSPQLPSAVVRRNSGLDCQVFAPKKKVRPAPPR
jgi:hypothetical protein